MVDGSSATPAETSEHSLPESPESGCIALSNNSVSFVCISPPFLLILPILISHIAQSHMGTVENPSIELKRSIAFIQIAICDSCLRYYWCLACSWLHILNSTYLMRPLNAKNGWVLALSTPNVHWYLKPSIIMYPSTKNNFMIVCSDLHYRSEVSDVYVRVSSWYFHPGIIWSSIMMHKLYLNCSLSGLSFLKINLSTPLRHTSDLQTLVWTTRGAHIGKMYPRLIPWPFTVIHQRFLRFFLWVLYRHVT